jgi:beta-glucanase (GH16 family)
MVDIYCNDPYLICIIWEIDLMEYYRVNDVPTMHANTAHGRSVWNATRTPMSHFTDRDSDWDKKFHVWRMDWTENYIRLYIDGELLNEIDVAKTVNPDGFNPFRHHQYMLINLAIGRKGESPGETPFPVRFEIDYVRVYQQF